MPEDEAQTLVRHASSLPSLEISTERLREVENIATGVYSPLDGFMTQAQLVAVLRGMRLPSGVPWTIPILCDVPAEQASRLPGRGRVVLTHGARPVAILHVAEKYRADLEAIATWTYGTADPAHPGVASTMAMSEIVLGGPVDLLSPPESAFPRYRLTPRETRVLFEEKGWRTVVGFQTRNVPHIGHEYVQKGALGVVDGLFINPVIGKKKRGDFRDDVIVAAYEALIKGYYPHDRVVLAILEQQMRYAGPREAIFHAIIRKNFGCSHISIGRDHAGVGSFYGPYAAHAIFDEFPDLGITPLFFRAFFHCKRCGGVANEKTCPHDDRQDFSGTLMRKAFVGEAPLPAELIRTEVAAAVQQFANPFVE